MMRPWLHGAECLQTMVASRNMIMSLKELIPPRRIAGRGIDRKAEIPGRLDREKAFGSQNYGELLGDGGLILPVEKPEARHVYHLFVVRVPNRDKVQAYLKEKGIATGFTIRSAFPTCKPINI